MKLLKILIIIMFSFQAYSAYTQTIGKAYDGKYIYDGQIYSYGQLADILKSDDLAYRKFKESKSAKRSSNIFGISTIAVLVAGISVMSEEDDPSKGTYSIPNSTSGLFIILGGGTALMTMGIIKSSKARKLKNLSIDFFNDAQDIGLIQPSHPFSIDYGITRNGLGFTLTF